MDGIQCLVLVSFVSLESFFRFLARDSHRPSWEGFHEVGRVGIVDHSHGAKRVIESSNEALHLSCTLRHGAKVEDLGDIGERVRLAAKLSELLEAGLNHVGALLVSLAVIRGGDVIIGIGVDVAIEEEDRSTSSEGTLEYMRVLHTEPG